MAPPRRIVRQQLEILIEFLEENKDMCNGLMAASPVSHQETRQKWTAVAKRLNNVQSGALKTPEGWKKYWFEWRHKCRRKAADARRFMSVSDGGSKRIVPLNDLEIRVLELSGKGSITSTVTSSKDLDNFLEENSDSEPLENVKMKTVKAKRTSSNSRTSIDDNGRSTPPPKWAIELEERRIAAEERMAESLESIASMMRVQEERRSILDERVADALTAIAGTLQDLNSGVQEAVQHWHPIRPRPDIKGDVFL